MQNFLKFIAFFLPPIQGLEKYRASVFLLIFFMSDLFKDFFVFLLRHY